MAVIIAIRKLRESRGLSQNDLARLTGYSPQFIQKIEQGKAKSLTLDAAERFVVALNCTPGELLERTPEQPDPTTDKQVVEISSVQTIDQNKAQLTKKKRGSTSTNILELRQNHKQVS